MPEASKVPPGSSFAFDTAIASLEEQRKRIDALDSKAGVTLAASGVFAGLVFRGDSLIVQGPRVIGVVGATALMLATVAALAAFATRNYRAAPAPEAVISLMSFPDDWLRWRFLGNAIEAIDVNRTKLKHKARLLTVAQVALLVAVGVLGGYFIYTLGFGRSGGM